MSTRNLPVPILGEPDFFVARLEPAVRALAECKDAAGAKKVADLARAAEVYARRQRLSEEAIAYATAVKVDAMTLMGEFLRAAKPKGVESTNGELSKGRGSLRGRDKVLPDNVSKKDSSDAQALAAIREKAPELHEQVRTGKTTVAKARVELKREGKREELKEKAAAAPPPAEPSWQVITGDCTAELGKVEPGSVRLVFADPPYNQGVDYGEGAAADRLPDAEYQSWCLEWMAAAARTLTPDGSMWVLISDEYAADFARMLGCPKVGLCRKQWLVWYETFGVNNPGGFTRSSRHLLWYVKDPHNLVFHPEPVTRESWRLRNGDKRADPAGRTWDSVWGIDPPIPRLVGTAAERIPDFPTQLPLALLRPVVGCASDPGDLVLDPFSGSATTGAACVELGRRFIGVERSARFAELARLRLQSSRSLP